MLTGEATDAMMLDQAISIARQFGPESSIRSSVMSPQQVMLEVRFVEISRDAGRELGFQWKSVRQQNYRPTSATPPTGCRFFPAPVTAGVLRAVHRSASGAPLHQRRHGHRRDDQCARDAGIARRLAEPNLVALSGDTASFLAGGEFPIPVAGTLGQITVEFKKYGVGLAFTPTVLSARPDQPEDRAGSQPDRSNNVGRGCERHHGAGFDRAPGLDHHRAARRPELRDWRAVAEQRPRTRSSSCPGSADVPVLGTLFSSKRYQKKETDLVIIVTPRLVHPARPGDVLKTPTDKTVPPNDNDLFLNGKTEMTPTEIRKLYGPVSRRPQVGHQLDSPEISANAN